GHSVLILGAPAGFKLDAKAATRLGSGAYDVILFFTKERARLERELAGLRKAMAPACGLWVCWPKKASKVPTDMTEEIDRAIALPTGLVDNKVCAVDEVWSGLRLVIRLENRKA